MWPQLTPQQAHVVIGGLSPQPALMALLRILADERERPASSYKAACFLEKLSATKLQPQHYGHTAASMALLFRSVYSACLKVRGGPLRQCKLPLEKKGKKLPLVPARHSLPQQFDLGKARILPRRFSRAEGGRNRRPIGGGWVRSIKS